MVLGDTFRSLASIAVNSLPWILNSSSSSTASAEEEEKGRPYIIQDRALHPLYTIAQLALYSLYPDGTKIKPGNCQWQFQLPELSQSLSRSKEVGRENLAPLLKSQVIMALKWYQPKNNMHFRTLCLCAKVGLKKLQMLYKASPVTTETLLTVITKIDEACKEGIAPTVSKWEHTIKASSLGTPDIIKQLYDTIVPAILPDEYIVGDRKKEVENKEQEKGLAMPPQSPELALRAIEQLLESQIKQFAWITVEAVKILLLCNAQKSAENVYEPLDIEKMAYADPFTVMVFLAYLSNLPKNTKIGVKGGKIEANEPRGVFGIGQTYYRWREGETHNDIIDIRQKIRAALVLFSPKDAKVRSIFLRSLTGLESLMQTYKGLGSTQDLLQEVWWEVYDYCTMGKQPKADFEIEREYYKDLCDIWMVNDRMTQVYLGLQLNQLHLPSNYFKNVVSSEVDSKIEVEEHEQLIEVKEERGLEESLGSLSVSNKKKKRGKNKAEPNNLSASQNNVKESENKEKMDKEIALRSAEQRVELHKEDDDVEVRFKKRPALPAFPLLTKSSITTVETACSVVTKDYKDKTKGAVDKLLTFL